MIARQLHVIGRWARWCCWRSAATAADAGADSLAKPAAAPAPALRNNPATVRQAMEDELARSMKDLHMGDDEPRPYFIAYTISDLEQATTSATLGATTAAHAYRGRLLRTEVRVGDANFDNSNFEGGAQRRVGSDRGRLRGAAPRAVAAQRRGLQERGRDAGAQALGGRRAGRRRRRRRHRRFLAAGGRARRGSVRRQRGRSGGAARDRAAGCRWCSRRSPRSTDRTSPERPRSCAAGWRPARDRGSTTTSAPSASTSSPTRRPTTA